MSTRSNIGIVNNKNGTVTTIYCHHDGYEEGVGKILMEHYQDENKIWELMKLGDISSLGPQIGVKHDFEDRSGDFTTAYGRDRGDISGTEAIRHRVSDFRSLYEQDYLYLWNQGEWWVKSSGAPFVVLTREMVGLPPLKEEKNKIIPPSTGEEKESLKDKVVRFTYTKKKTKEQSTRIVLVSEDSPLYLKGVDLVQNSFRSFEVGGISKLTVVK